MHFIKINETNIAFENAYNQGRFRFGADNEAVYDDGLLFCVSLHSVLSLRTQKRVLSKS